ncbi:LacI family DNA-binding transcriptional regulator [Clostridium algidicarnis]|uniref:LacI family DNA-binding transcriptional regulator n=1 Tax=Clostridium algidicarnis TaxID=37659 RepID=UPI001C0D06CF|nr:LacI family DNA-binding transcriptional regulator [Clostridium algidicarnis]MBU3196680.1 LacI family transcriptional regulator [Clostridium algidicarnis]MBU3227743.1 LacI family transcriptional regulator [Clostridium algidicarnis]MBU3251495.1 LacI family transcriptional regulator [Clostridium algidicarnis]
MKIKLKDIAKEANVSITSVSLVLNNKPCRISSEKKDLIKKIAKDNNYTPNINARSLITNETKTLGLIIPDIENIFFSRLTKTIETYCRQFGYALIIVNSNDEYKEDLYLLDLLLARGIDGLFITISNSAYNNKEEVCSKLKKLAIPYIMVDRVFDELNCNQVYFDNVKGSYLATKHLIENGHSKISCITNSIYSKNTVSRFEGYKKAMQEYGLEIKKDYIIEGDYRMQSGYNTGDMIIKNHTTAVFVTNDMMTLGLLKRLSEKDIKVPEYLSIVSYDNLLNDFILGPGITSINQNISNLGKTACDLMLSLIKNEETAIKKICLDPELIIKKSVKNIV